MTWTHFWDMHSGGSQKLAYGHIFIEAPKDEAKVIFYNRFGRNPERVTCTCCGEDYSISSSESLEQATGFERGCRSLETPRDPETGLYRNDDPVIKAGIYLEDGEEPPEGYSLSRWPRFGREYQTLAQYEAREDVSIVRAADIKPEERTGDIPEQGYVWVD